MSASAAEAARGHLDWVVTALGGARPTADEAAARLTTAFLLQVSPEKVVSILGDLASAGVGVEDMAEPASGALVARLSTGWTVELSVEPTPPHRITGLLLKRPPLPADAAASAVEGAHAQLAWVLARLSGDLPTEADIVAHVDEAFAAAVPPGQIVAAFAAAQEPETTAGEIVELPPTGLRTVTSSGVIVELAVEPGLPHRIAGLRFRPVEPDPVDDDRLANPPRSITAPAALAERMMKRFEADGMVGLVGAGWRQPPADDPEVSIAIGWADLDRGEAVTFGHRFPAYSITKLCTAVAALRLVAGGLVDLDGPANQYLTTLRLGSDEATVRQLLTHTAGVASSFEHWVDEVPPSLVDVLGDVVPHQLAPGGPYFYSNGGYAVLGQLVADVRGRAYESVVVDEILTPLAMTASDFPRRAPWPAAGVASGHEPVGGKVGPCPSQVAATPAAGGLWTTAADLARFAFGWRDLVPGELAPLVSPFNGRIWGHTGGGIGFRSALLAKPDEGMVAVAFSNRRNAVHGIASSIIDALGAG